MFDQLAQTFLNLSMSWHWSLLAISNIGINIMSAAMPFQVTPFIGQVSDEVSPLQGTSIFISIELYSSTGTGIDSCAISW